MGDLFPIRNAARISLRNLIPFSNRFVPTIRCHDNTSVPREPRHASREMTPPISVPLPPPGVTSQPLLIRANFIIRNERDNGQPCF
ncbi:hypothetical protein CEXT_412791 [Caerostris extrusa]|uniref:Uncharacterized protein n=1 Tax=Caerostris extrusa TaxID=172846 RepID=A0AAV4XRJ4_CAEEX|nr:hypothetical protein CEXT_412791 [Caerostris extrusa]